MNLTYRFFHLIVWFKKLTARKCPTCHNKDYGYVWCYGEGEFYIEDKLMPKYTVIKRCNVCEK